MKVIGKWNLTSKVIDVWDARVIVLLIYLVNLFVFLIYPVVRIFRMFVVVYLFGTNQWQLQCILQILANVISSSVFIQSSSQIYATVSHTLFSNCGFLSISMYPVKDFNKLIVKLDNDIICGRTFLNEVRNFNFFQYFTEWMLFIITCLHQNQ